MKLPDSKLFIAVVFILAIFITGCKKEGKSVPSEELVIPLQPGVIHIGAHMEGNTLWVESFDPKTNACLLRNYSLDGQIIDESPKIRLKGCRIQVMPAATPVPAQAPAPPAKAPIAKAPAAKKATAK